MQRLASELISRAAVQLLLLAAAVWAITYARVSLGPLQEALRVDLGLTDNEIALVQGPALALPMALASIPLGLIVDRYSRVRLFLFSVALSVVATVLTAIAPNLSVLVVARGLLGFGVAAVLVGAYSLVADLYPPAQRGRATTIVALGEIGGAPAAFALGGALLVMAGPLASLDFGSRTGGWRWALLWMSGPLAIVALLMAGLREPPRTDIVVQHPRLRDIAEELWRYRTVVAPLLFARVMVWIADGAVFVWAAPTFARRFALAQDRIGAIIGGALLISGILGPIIGGPLADLCQRTGGPQRTATILAVVALLSVPAGLFAVVPNPTLAGLMLTAFLTLGFAFGTAAMTLGTVVIPGEVRGLFLAASVTVAALFSTGVAPVAISLLSRTLGGTTMIGHALAWVCALTSLLGALIFALGRRGFAAPLVQTR